MSIEPPRVDPAGVDMADPLAPLRQADRRARVAAAATVGGTLAGMAAAATIPLWSHEERIRPVLFGSDLRGAVHWAWELAPHDGWWAFGLVLLVPCLAAVTGAVLTGRRLARAAAAASFQVRPTRTPAGSGGGHVTDAQRRAREQGRRETLLTQQRHVVAQTRKGSVWTDLGGCFAVVMWTWFGAALALSALGLQATALGIGIAVASWWIAILPVALCPAVTGARRALTRRRASVVATGVTAANEGLRTQAPASETSTRH